MIVNLEEKFNKPFEIFAACKNNNILRFIIIENNNGELWVNNIFIKKYQQGKGIEKQLFGFITKD